MFEKNDHIKYFYFTDTDEYIELKTSTSKVVF